MKFIVVSRHADVQSEINKWKALGYKVVARLSAGGNNVILECRR